MRIILAILALGVASAQEGHWEGIVKAPNREVSIRVDLAKNDKQAWIGSFEADISNAPKGIPIENISVSGDTITFDVAIPGRASKFTGKINAETKTLAGTVTAQSGDLPFELKRTGEAKVVVPPPSTPIAQDLEGRWEGTLEANQSLRLVVNFKTVDGKGAGNLISIDQGSLEFPMTYLAQEGNKITFEIRIIGGKYVAILNEAKNELSGDWTQGPNTLPLVLKKQKAEVK